MLTHIVEGVASLSIQLKPDPDLLRHRGYEINLSGTNQIM